MSASEKKNFTFKFYVERTYEVEFIVPATDQETADQMAKDMADGCDEFPNEMIGKDDCYSVGEIELGFVREADTSCYTHGPSRKVAEWCEIWEEEQKDEDEDEDE